MSPADVALTALALAMVALLATGLDAAALRADVAPRLGFRIAIVAIAWLALTAFLARLGIFSDWSARPPRVPLLPLTALVVLVSASRTAVARQLLQSAPPHWPVAAQTFRVLVELVLYRLYVEGRAPVQVTFEGHNFDILAGLTAPIVAWLLATKASNQPTPYWVLGWNVVGLLLLANVVVTAASSLPGPFQYSWAGGSFAALATWPVVWIPAFLAPCAVFLHVVSIRQMLRQLRERSNRSLA